jgi:nitrile hydratase subunit beta
MDGVHDMGGMHGFGKVEPEQNEPVFHDEWERRLYALYRAMSYAGVWVIDQARFARERLPPAVYLASSYYRKWELGMEKLLAELGLAGADELAAGHALGLRKRRHDSSRATACAPRTFIRRRIRGCHVTRAIASA